MGAIKFVLGLLSLAVRGILTAFGVKKDIQSDMTEAEKTVAVEKRLESFRKKCGDFAASTEAEWDDAIFAGLADFMDEAAEFIVAKWGTTKQEE